jgi:hypothetical protein
VWIVPGAEADGGEMGGEDDDGDRGEVYAGADSLRIELKARFESRPEWARPYAPRLAGTGPRAVMGVSA